MFACREVNLLLKWYEAYVERCVAEKQRKDFLRLFSGFITSMKKLCHPGPYQEGRWTDDERG